MMIVTVQQNTRDLLGGNSLIKVESPSLRLNKFLQYERRADDKELERICACANSFGKKISPPVVSGVLSFKMRLGGRMMVNQSGGILNAGLELHRNFGCPMIPGSALKGIARHAAWCDWKDAEEAKDVEKAKELAIMIANVFGNPTGNKPLDDSLREMKEEERSGSVAFLPAFPASSDWKLVVDVLTSHGGCDTKNPVPVFFPAVEKGATFRFSLNPVQGRGTKENLDIAVKYLKKGLSENGAGAKTAAGYGWFKEIK